MSNEAILLHRALQNAAQELERLGKLIKAEAGDLPDELQQESETIRELFSDEWDALRKECREIREGISQRDPGSRDISGLWARYTRLRYERLPKLTGELLAVIGGIHLRQVGLDELGSPGISFTNVAQQLLAEDLSKRSNYPMRSLLIVAEERYEPSNARILRLRFPACDIWHLPFTAYEHGYLFARDVKIDEVERLRNEVRTRVDPTLHRWGQLPEDQSCFLPEVREFWTDFRAAVDEIKEPEAKDSFYASKKPEIEALEHTQVVHLCRLLADAFATFYVGPAYTYALLHLSFEPIKLTERGEGSAGACLALNKSVSPWMPPFLQRLVVSMETLRWMNDDAARTGVQGFDQTLFLEDPMQTSSILGAYYQACMAINNLTNADPLRTCYTTTKEALGPWLEKFRGIFRQKAEAYEETLANWNQIEEMSDYLNGNQVDYTNNDFRLWGVVNAAWHARHQTEISPQSGASPVNPTSSIEQRAMELIIRKLNPEVGKGTLPGRASGRVRGSQDPQQIRQELVGKMLFAQQEAQKKNNRQVDVLLADMIKSDSYWEQEVVASFLQQTNGLGSSYGQAYRLLHEQDTRAMGSTEAQPRRKDDEFKR
ncbi:MAG TPA: hypothetical protein VL334_13775 [Anaerolineae bacterium]|nr:hypothetical protein [Anaerolineae bacterium]